MRPSVFLYISCHFLGYETREKNIKYLIINNKFLLISEFLNFLQSYGKNNCIRHRK